MPTTACASTELFAPRLCSLVKPTRTDAGQLFTSGQVSGAGGTSVRVGSMRVLGGDRPRTSR